jgi:tetratricopeptide (TPR) repeat protein
MPIDEMNSLIELQAEALAQLPASETDLRRLLLGCFVVCLTNSGATFERVNPVSLEEVALAREIRDDSALFDALGDRLAALAGSPHLAERRAFLAELTALPPPRGYYAALSTEIHGAPLALATGDRPAFEEQLAKLRVQSARGHSAFQAAMCFQWDGTLALLDGRFAEVEPLAVRQLELSGNDPNFLLSYAGQLVAQRLQTGRDAEVLDGIEKMLDRHPNLPLLLATKAWVCAATGREDAARALVDDLAPDGFVRLGRGLLWPACMAQLTEAIAALGTIDHARTMYELLEPWSGQGIVVGQGLDMPGAADRYLGMLSATVGRTDEADAQYAAAVELEDRMQAPPLVARTRYWWGRALLTRGHGGDVERAVALLEQCVPTADELGMTRLASDARHQLDRV